MPRVGGMFGPDVTFLGVERCDLGQPDTFKGADAIIIGAPYDAGATYRGGARFGPKMIRTTDYLPHDSSRPHLALRVDPLQDLRVLDAGDVEMPGMEQRLPLDNLENAVRVATEAGAIPIILGGDHTITWPDVTGVARVVGWGRVSVIHFDAHADTGAGWSHRPAASRHGAKDRDRDAGRRHRRGRGLTALRHRRDHSIPGQPCRARDAVGNPVSQGRRNLGLDPQDPFGRSALNLDPSRHDQLVRWVGRAEKLID